MEKVLLWSAYVLASLAIFFSEDIKRWVGDRGERVAAGAAPVVDPAQEALATLETAAAGPADTAMDELATNGDTWVTGKLIEMLENRSAVIARRAAMVLVQRQDPAAMQALFRYFAKH